MNDQLQIFPLKKIQFQLLGYFLLFSATLVQGQTILGKVIDAKTLEPLPFANVFLNNTTIGTTTEWNGEFTLKNVRQPAVYEVIFSFVGYESYKMKVSLTENELRLGTIRMKPSDIELTSVEVKGSKDTEWEKKLKKFKKIFFGDDKAAELCTLTNPWVIDFPEGGKGFKAVANAPLEIENRALGYKVRFYLSSFLGDSFGYSILGNARFEEMEPTDEKERASWSLNRQKSYRHSRQHLFKAILDHRINGNGFNLYTDVAGHEDDKVRPAFFYSELGGTGTIKRYDTTDLVTATPQKGVYRIALKGRVEVHYTMEKVPVRAYRDVFGPVSWIRLKKDFVLVNSDGFEFNPGDVTVSGALSADRVAQLLPLDYLPEESLLRQQKEDLLPFLEEKIYVHTDKPYYYPGESIWFKGYVNYRAPALMDSLSKTVYVELLDREHQVVKQVKVLRIDSGLFHGDFLLPDVFSPGYYYLRAYTNLNRNFGDNNLFVKPIPVMKLTDKVKADPKGKGVISDTVLALLPDRKKYKTREKITLTLRLKDEEDQPLASNLSLSVTDATQVAQIEIADAILDSYPLKENQVPPAPEESFYSIEYGISLAGRFYNDNKKPQKAMLNVLQLNPQNFTVAESDEKGNFSVSGFSFQDTTDFSIQGVGVKGATFGKVELLGRAIPPMDFNEIGYRLDFEKTEMPQRIQYKPSPSAKMLKEVEIKASRIEEEYTIEYRIKRPYGKPNYVLKAKDINASYGNLLYALPGKFPGLVVRQAWNPGNDAGGRWVVYLLKNAAGSLSSPPEVLVTVNDCFVGGTPADILGAIDPATVESVELKTGVNVLYGAAGFGGILSVYTRQGVSEEEAKVKKNIPIVKVPGYSKSTRFEFPDHSNPRTEVAVADYRSLLYWNPDVRTGPKTGMTTVSFFASDLPGRYRVVAEGVTQQGKPVRCVTFIEIEKK